MGQALELEQAWVHWSDQAQEPWLQSPGPKAAGTWPSSHIGPLDLGSTDQAWETGNRPAEGLKGPLACPRSLPTSHSGLRPLRPAPMGLNLSLSLSAPSCFPSEAENGSLVTNMASGHWVMRSLFSLLRSTKGPFVPLPAPLSGSSPAPHPPRLPPPRLPPHTAPLGCEE